MITEFCDGRARLSLQQEDERQLAPRSKIAAILLGESHRLQLGNVHKKLLKEIEILHGSLYVMDGDAHENISHGIAPNRGSKRGFSIVFRHTRGKGDPSQREK